eukprot:4326814-Alexandrium_andersonii.AAC.1
MQSVRGAQQWMKCTEAPQWAIKSEDGRIIAGRSAAVVELRRWWGALFQQQGRRSIAERLRFYAR